MHLLWGEIIEIVVASGNDRNRQPVHQFPVAMNVGVLDLPGGLMPHFAQLVDRHEDPQRGGETSSYPEQVQRAHK
jgi:hypothetical protein